MLTETQISIAVADGRPVFGTWQDLYLFHHWRRPHQREVALNLFALL